MPAINFNVQWPDGDTVSYYSPSTIIRDYFEERKSYSMDDFKEKSLSALDEASERVRKRFGFYCSAASNEKEKITNKYQYLKEQGVCGMVVLTQFEN